MAGQRRWHAFRIELAAPRPQDPGDGERRQSAHHLNDACASAIEKAQLREPSAAPRPVRKQRIGPPGEQHSGSAAGAQIASDPRRCLAE